MKHGILGGSSDFTSLNLVNHLRDDLILKKNVKLFFLKLYQWIMMAIHKFELESEYDAIDASSQR